MLRQRVIKIRLSDSEHEKLLELAGEMPLAKFIRDTILQDGVTTENGENSTLRNLFEYL